MGFVYHVREWTDELPFMSKDVMEDTDDDVQAAGHAFNSDIGLAYCLSERYPTRAGALENLDSFDNFFFSVYTAVMFRAEKKEGSRFQAWSEASRELLVDSNTSTLSMLLPPGE